MEILLTGNTCFVTPAWVEMAFPEDHVLITCARGQPHPPRIRTITLDSKERIGQLVDSYEFDRPTGSGPASCFIWLGRKPC